ncbi:MAG: heme-binding protein [Motiliproteus sp.]|nr:heme-binding protein [Motiliproteus sp.]
MTSLNAVAANRLVNRAIARAEQLSVNICVAVVDTGGQLMAFRRMDNAFAGSVDVAIAKARTSVLFPLPTEDFGELVREQKLTGMELTNQGLIGFAGGMPMKIEEELLGAVGISGASAEQDADVARYALLQGES